MVRKMTVLEKLGLLGREELEDCACADCRNALWEAVRGRSQAYEGMIVEDGGPLAVRCWCRARGDYVAAKRVYCDGNPPCIEEENPFLSDLPRTK